jgi:exonuclease III
MNSDDDASPSREEHSGNSGGACAGAMSTKSSIQRTVTPSLGSRKRKRYIQPPVNDDGDGNLQSDGQQHRRLTVYSWNVNGIAPFISSVVQPSVAEYFQRPEGSSSSQLQSPGPKASLRDFLRRHQWPEVLLLQEVKINPDDISSIRAVETAVKRQEAESPDAHDYEAYFCLPSDRHNARGFGRNVYGVCTIIREDYSKTVVERIQPVNWDAEGRFLMLETKESLGIPKLAIINVYAVNGTDNPYKDSKTGEILGTRHDRKIQVHSLLQAECRRLEADGFGVILAGDGKSRSCVNPLLHRDCLRYAQSHYCNLTRLTKLVLSQHCSFSVRRTSKSKDFSQAALLQQS